MKKITCGLATMLLLCTVDVSAESLQPNAIVGHWIAGDAISGWNWDFRSDGVVKLEELIGPQARIPIEEISLYEIIGDQVIVNFSGERPKLERVLKNGSLC